MHVALDNLKMVAFGSKKQNTWLQPAPVDSTALAVTSKRYKQNSLAVLQKSLVSNGTDVFSSAQTRVTNCLEKQMFFPYKYSLLCDVIPPCYVKIPQPISTYCVHIH